MPDISNKLLTEQELREAVKALWWSHSENTLSLLDGYLDSAVDLIESQKLAHGEMVIDDFEARLLDVAVSLDNEETAVKWDDIQANIDEQRERNR